MNKLNESVETIEKFVSERLKLRRTMLGMSQQELGEAVNLSVKQIQKYEDASSVIPSSRLYFFAKFLKVSLSYFIDTTQNSKLPTNYLSDSKQVNDNSIVEDAIAEEGEEYFAPIQYDQLVYATKQEIISLIKAFSRVQSPKIRCKIVELIKSMISNSS